MAGQRGPTGVHIVTILFGMASLIFAVTTYISYREYDRVSGELVSAEQNRAASQAQAREKQIEIDQLSRWIGYSHLPVGGGQPGEASILGRFSEDLTTYGGAQQGPNFSSTIVNMRAEIDNLRSRVSTLQSELDQRTVELLSAETLAALQINGDPGNPADGGIVGAQEMDEADLVRRINDNAETVAARDALIARWKQDLQREQQEKADLSRQLQTVREEGLRLVSLLDRRILSLIDELNRLRQVAFEVPHGRIVLINNVTRQVYVDIGSEHLVKPGVAFNVYVQNPRDIGRGPQDIKGAIEITSVLGPRLSEARIIDQDPTRPFAPRDLIYSPIWNPGVREEFAFVGTLDLNGDGKTDWERLRQLVELAGGRVEFYVDDQGHLQPENGVISEYTTYLVVGDIPDPDDFFGDPERQEIAARIQQQHRDLTRSAQWYGVRVLRMNDFLTHINWKPDLSITHGPGTSLPVGTAAVRELLEESSVVGRP